MSSTFTRPDGTILLGLGEAGPVTSASHWRIETLGGSAYQLGMRYQLVNQDGTVAQLPGLQQGVQLLTP